jgi:putative ABC transport system permease protein
MEPTDTPMPGRRSPGRKPRSRFLSGIAHSLLLFYPPSFRKEYGEEWSELAIRRLVSHRPLARRFAILVSLFLDTLKTAPGTWRMEDPPGGSGVGRKASIVETLLQDIRFGLRALRRRPLFALMALGTLGLGIGAATAIFSVVEGVLLRPLPYDHPEELVSIWQTYPEWREEPALAHAWDWGYLSYPGYERLRNGQSHFQDVAIFGSTFRNFSGQGDPERIRVGIASSSLFPILGARPALGRGFLPGEDTEGGPRVVVLSHSFWVERFGSDPGVLGQTVNLDQEPFTIVGIMPPEFQLLDHGFLGSSGRKPVWIPVGADGYRRRDNSHSYEAIARLGEGVEPGQAVPESARLVAAPDEGPGHSVRIVPLEDLELAGMRAPLFLLLGASVVLLLIGCGNVATLLLGEFTSRRPEIATRAALGAGSGRLIRQLLTESIILGAGGSALGVGISILGTRTLLRVAPSIPRLEQVQVNTTVLLFAIALGVLTGLLFGTAPTWEITRTKLNDAMGSRRISGGPSGSLLQRTVITAELALTVVLLVSGSLLARSFGELMAVDTGFQRENLTMVRVFLPRYRYGSPSDRAAQAERMRASLEAVPGVTSASGTNSLPFYNGPNALSYGIEGQEIPEELSPHTSLRAVLPGFLETMGIRIVEGRALTGADDFREDPVAVISETMARRHWPDASPIGARILFGDTLEVVGVAADVIHESLDAEPLATMYVPFARGAGTSINFVVRTAGDPEALLPAFRRAIWAVDGEAPISRVATLPALVRDSSRNERFRATIIVAFALCATLLAGAGVFGVTARGVSRRTREMGIRNAMGAAPSTLVRLALAGTFRVGLMGVGLGLVGAAFVSRLLTRFLFQVEPWDPAIYLGTSSALLAFSLLASLLPALRAGRVPPMDVLREE